jgi:hypothetical protein
MTPTHSSIIYPDSTILFKKLVKFVNKSFTNANKIKKNPFQDRLNFSHPKNYESLQDF